MSNVMGSMWIIVGIFIVGVYVGCLFMNFVVHCCVIVV